MLPLGVGEGSTLTTLRMGKTRSVTEGLRGPKLSPRRGFASGLEGEEGAKSVASVAPSMGVPGSSWMGDTVE